MSMSCSSVCEKNKDGSGGGKLKKICFNTLDKTPLLIGNICSQFCGEKSLKRVGKTGSKSFPKILIKTTPKCPFL